MQQAVDGEIANWTRLTREQPQEARAWVQLAEALMQRSREAHAHDDYDRVEEAFQKALALAVAAQIIRELAGKSNEGDDEAG